MAEQAPVDSGATLWRPALAELIATMLFVFIGPCAVVVTGMITGGQMDTGRLLAISVAHGLAIAVLATAIANTSGGHINPAVTIAALVTGKIGGMRAVYYIVAQLVGAVIGSSLLLMAWAPAPGLADTRRTRLLAYLAP
jgi:glycerol uptake facilitator-like aquaporin